MRAVTTHPLPTLGRRLLAIGLLVAAAFASAQPPAGAPAGARPAAERSLGEWLERMHVAALRHNYVGTFVVSSSGGAMSSARIWHACDGQRQVDRLENLTGAPRSTFRRDGEQLTLLPEQRLARVERREVPGRFPDLLKSGEAAVADFYSARQAGTDRVAGFDADMVLLSPRDALRYGYRIWSERRTGLVVKLQTLGPEGEVLEQSAFSELQLDAPLRVERLAQAMTAPEGWRVERIESVKINAGDEGWTLKAPVPGFKAVGSQRRRGPGGEGPLQWVFSDGLASVSLFLEPFDRQRHVQEGLMSSGATQTLTRRVQDSWVTAVGEVPPQTLRAFVQGLERRR